MSRYALFDRTRLCLRSLSERGHDLTRDQCLPLQAPDPPYDHPSWSARWPMAAEVSFSREIIGGRFPVCGMG